SIIELKQMPLTVNGKLDRKSLPVPEFTGNNYVAPSNEIEKDLCQIWREALGVKRVGMTDDFFRMGGHSILVIQVSYRMSEVLHRRISISDIFQYRTLESIQKMVDTSDYIVDITATSGSVPLSFAQERLWFIEQYEGGTDLYHIPKLYALSKKTSVANLKKALTTIVNRHEVLRTTFKSGENGIYFQVVNNNILPINELTVLESDLDDTIDKEIHKKFDLTKDYPIRVVVYKVKETSEQILLLIFHHIAFDEWSGKVFQNELLHLYKGEKLPELPFQYKDFSAWQAHALEDQRNNNLKYWVKKLSGVEFFRLTNDNADPIVSDFSGEVLDFAISKDISDGLKSIAKMLGVTLYTVLLSSVVILLSRFSGQSDIVIGTPIANRANPQVEHLIGFFVNILPLRLQVEEDKSLADCIMDVYFELVEAQKHQEVNVLDIVDEIDLDRDSSQNKLFNVMFNVSYEQKESLELLTARRIDNHTAKFDLTFDFVVSEDGVSGSINYATSLYKKDTILRVIKSLQFLLGEINGCV
ncbi:MAG: condensation domain-containing protein, partial [Legionellaceae bacterium]|nr:condensation domain-containing protein [Legionellaceae bacterium]